MNITLGTGPDGAHVVLPERVLATHVHIIGSTGTGKSKALEQMMRQLIMAGRGLCLIDPNGALYNDMVRWCAACGWPRRIHLLNPHMEGWGFGFNPFQGRADASVRVDAAIVACAQVFGGEDMDAKPRLLRILRTIFMALVANGLTFGDALHLLESERGRELRVALSTAIEDPIAAQSLRELTVLRHREFIEMTESTLNRLTAFLAPPSVRRIVSQANGIDFLECMNAGEIILLNLNPGHGMSEQNARLLGTLFVNALFAQARTRGTGKRPFYLVVDEAYRYLTEDVEKILDEGRKYGLHLVLAHQRIGQLEAAGDNIKSAVMGMARTKIVFGGLTPEEAEIMEGFLYMGSYDLQRVKPRLTTPVTAGHEIVWLRNQSVSRGSALSDSVAQATAVSETTSSTVSDSAGLSLSLSRSDGTGLSESYDPDDEDEEATGASRSRTQSTSYGLTSSRARSQAWGASHSRTASETTGRSWTTSESVSSGAGETLKAVLEERALQTYSLQEQRYERAAFVRNLPQRHAILKLPDGAAQPFRTATVGEVPASVDRVRTFNRRMLEASAYTRPIGEIEGEMEQRTISLVARGATLEAEAAEPGEPATLPARRTRSTR